MANPSPVLDLKTLIENVGVTIDGTLYTFRSRAVRSVLETAKIINHDKVLAELWPQVLADTISVEDAGRFVQNLEAICKLILEAPDDVLAKLDDFQRMEIRFSFMTLHGTKAPQPTGAAETESEALPADLLSPITASSPPDSAASMAEAPGIG